MRWWEVEKGETRIEEVRVEQTLYRFFPNK